MAGIHPVCLIEKFGDELFDIGSQAQFGEIMGTTLLRFDKETLVAEKNIASDQRRFMLVGKSIIILPQGRRNLLGGMLVAVIDFNR